MNKLIQNKLLQVYDRFSISENIYELTDNAFYEFQFVDKPNSVLAIVHFQEKIGLLEIDRYLVGNSLELVGGRIKDTDANEYEAIKRELIEEINITEYSLSLISVVYPLPNLTNEKVFVFDCELQNNEFNVSNSEGIISFKFYNINEIINLIMNDKIKSSIDGYSLTKFLINKKLIIP